MVYTVSKNKFKIMKKNVDKKKPVQKQDKTV